MAFVRMLAAASIIGLAAAEAPIVLKPIDAATDKNPTLLVFVPGGDVPHQVYVPLMKELQTQLADKVRLWVTIAYCTGNLCLPKVSSLAVASALKAGRKASNITDANKTWMAGHSLGGVEADMYMQSNNGSDIGGGGMLWGAQVSAVSKVLKYPVPVLTLVGDLDYGSARLTKLAPYWSVAVRKTPNDPAQTPVVVLKNVDHSDMCETFHVPGDLPSASSPDTAVKDIVAASAAFMSRIITGDANDVKRMVIYDQFTEKFMNPLNDALAQERNGEWCRKAQEYIAGDYASKVVIKTTAHTGLFHSWPAPKATLSSSGLLHIEVSESNKGGQAVDDSFTSSLQAPVPPPGRTTATSVGCRMISRAKIAELLGEKNVPNPKNPCRAMNQKAWDLATQIIPQYILDRFHSNTPCNGCAPGLKVSFQDDRDVSTSFTKSPFPYNVGGDTPAPDVEGQFTIVSPTTLTDNEHSCQLVSPARLYDFLIFDAYSASRYNSSQMRAPIVV